MKRVSTGGVSRALAKITGARASLLRRALPCALAVVALVSGTAWSGVIGILVQLPGTAGCVSDGGSGGNCVDGTALDGAMALATTSNSLSVYVASPISHGVASFLRHPEGQLLQAGCVTQSGTGGQCAVGRALQGARDVALTSKGDTLYVAAPASNAVAVFARDKLGALTQLTGTAGCVSSDGTGGQCGTAIAMEGARAAVVSPDRKNVYVVARDADAVVAFARDKKTGALSQLPGTSGCISRSTTGGACLKGNGLDFATGIAITAKGDSLYVAAAGSGAISVFARDKTGLITQLPGTAGCVSHDGAGGCAVGRGLLGAFSVAVSKDAKFVYATARDGNAVAVFARDKETGALTQLAGTAGCVSADGSGGQCAVGRALNGPVSVAVARDGAAVYVASSLSNAVAAFARDKKTGALTQLAGKDGCVSSDGTGGQCAIGQGLVEASAVLVTRNGRSAYVASSTSDAVAAFERQ